MPVDNLLSDEERAALLSWCRALRLHHKLSPQPPADDDVITQLYDVMQSLSPTIFPPRSGLVDHVGLKEGVESFLVEVLGMQISPVVFQAREAARDLAGLVLFASMNGFTMSVQYIKAVLSLDKRQQAVLQHLMEPVQGWLNPPAESGTSAPCPPQHTEPAPSRAPVAMPASLKASSKDTKVSSQDVLALGVGVTRSPCRRCQQYLEQVRRLETEQRSRAEAARPCGKCQQHSEELRKLEGEHRALVEAHQVSISREAESARAARVAAAAQAEAADQLQAAWDARQLAEQRMASLERKADAADALRDRLRSLQDELDVAQQERERARTFERTAQQYRERLETALQTAQTAEDLEKQNQAYVLRIMELEDEVEKIPLLTARIKEQDTEILELERSLRESRAQCQQIQLKDVEREKAAHELTRADLSKARVKADELAVALEASQDDVATLSALIASLQGGAQDPDGADSGGKRASDFGGSLDLGSPGKENGGDYANMDSRVTVRGGKGAGSSKLLPLNLLLATDIQERLQRLERENRELKRAGAGEHRRLMEEMRGKMDAICARKREVENEYTQATARQAELEAALKASQDDGARLARLLADAEAQASKQALEAEVAIKAAELAAEATQKELERVEEALALAEQQRDEWEDWANTIC